MHFCDCYTEVDADSKGSGTSEESDQNQQSTKEFSEGGQISGPGWQAQAGDKLGMVMESAKNLVISMTDHDGAKSESHEEERERLQTI